MKYRVFTYPVPCDEAVAELNGFLSSHRILRVREEIVMKGSDPYLLFVEEAVPGAPSPSSAYSVSMPSWGSAFPERCFGYGNIGIGLSAMRSIMVP